jgi:hypothetical protein
VLFDVPTIIMLALAKPLMSSYGVAWFAFPGKAILVLEAQNHLRRMLFLTETWIFLVPSDSIRHGHAIGLLSARLFFQG